MKLRITDVGFQIGLKQLRIAGGVLSYDPRGGVRVEASPMITWTTGLRRSRPGPRECTFSCREIETIFHLGESVAGQPPRANLFPRNGANPRRQWLVGIGSD